MEEDFYTILGVDRDADSLTIRQAFKKLALTHHPDKVAESEREEAEVRFKIISEAYEVLSNEESRMLYDAQAQFGAGADWQDLYTGPEAEFFDFNDFGFNFAAPPPPRSRSSLRTDDTTFEVVVTLEDVFRGKMIKLSSQRQVLCRRCHGSGGRQNARKRSCNGCKGLGTTKRTQFVGPGMVSTSTVVCPVCNGEGQVFRDKDLCRRCKGKKTQEVKTIIEVYIPKGVKNRHRIVVENHSDEEPGKVAGDLIILVLVNAEHSVFRREGLDLYASAEVSLKEALTGFSRSLITHLDGRDMKITVPRGEILKPGSILRIPGEGLIAEDVNSATESTGDLYLQLSVGFPESIDMHILDKVAHLLSHEEDNDNERSGGTIKEKNGYATPQPETNGSIPSSEKKGMANGFSAHTHDLGIDVEHEILDESELPEYQDDVNDEPEPAKPSDSNFGFNFGGSGTAAPGCATM